jgi:hypothetical protein
MPHSAAPELSPSPSLRDKWSLATISAGTLLMILGFGIFDAKKSAQEWREAEPEIRARIETIAHQGAIGVNSHFMPLGPTSLQGGDILVAPLDAQFALVCREGKDRMPSLHLAPRGVPRGTPLPHRTAPETMRIACERIRGSF